MAPLDGPAVPAVNRARIQLGVGEGVGVMRLIVALCGLLVACTNAPTAPRVEAPVDAETAIAAVWKLYNMSDVAPPAVVWVNGGECEGDGVWDRTQTTAVCIWGQYFPTVTTAYVLANPSQRAYSLSHELMHARIDMLGSDFDIDTNHKRPEWLDDKHGAIAGEDLLNQIQF